MTSLVMRTVCVVAVLGTSLTGCTYYKTYQTPAPVAAAPNVIVQQRAPDTVVVPEPAPSTVVVPAQPPTVIVLVRDADSAWRIIVKPRPNSSCGFPKRRPRRASL